MSFVSRRVDDNILSSPLCQLINLATKHDKPENQPFSIGLPSTKHQAAGSSSPKTYVVIFYPSSRNHMLIRLWVDCLIPSEKDYIGMPLCKQSYMSMPLREHSALKKDVIDLPAGSHIHDPGMEAICTSTVGLGPRVFLFQNSRKVFRYDLHKPDNQFHRCTEMASKVVDDSLSVQIGDFFYVLSFAGGSEPIFQKYNIEKNVWALVPDVANIITTCDYQNWVRTSISTAPHVVIDRKLHVSLGDNHSFAFDTVRGVWVRSNLFENTFWSELNQSDFYGGPIWNVYDDPLSPNRITPQYADKSFGFYGKGIVWDKDILLGVHYSSKCQLVAFLLDDKNRAVKSQPLAFTDEGLKGAHLVDLGRGDYFGLVHVTGDDNSFGDEVGGCQLELVTFKVSRPLHPRVDHFLECRIVHKDCVAENFCYGIVDCSKAFCV